MGSSSKGFRDLIRLMVAFLVAVTIAVVFWRPETEPPLQQAREAQRVRDRDEARKSYREHLDSQPDDTSVRLEYARFLSEFDPERTLAELSKIPEKSPDWFEAQKLAVEVYDELGQLHEAQTLLEALVESEQTDGALHLQLARIYDRSGKGLFALQQVDLALQKNPELSDAYLLKALLFANFDRFPEMIAPLRECLERRPDDQFSRLNLAFAYRRSGNLDLAEQTLNAISNEKQNWPEFWLEQALLNKDQGETKLAEQNVERALKLNPDLLNARLLKGELLMISGNYELALQELQPLYQQERNNRQFLSLYARAAAFSGDRKLSEQLTRELSRLLEPP